MAVSEQAIQILDDANREFVSSPFVQLETLPKAQYHQQTDEVEFYETYCNEVIHWANDLERTT